MPQTPKDSSSLAELLIAETLTRMDGKLDKLGDRLDDQGRVMVTQQGILAEHVKRSDLLERKIDLDISTLKIELPKHIDEHLKIRAVVLSEKRQKAILFWLKVAGGLGGLAGSGFGLMHLLKFLGSLVGA